MTTTQIATAVEWLKTNRDDIARIRPRIAGHIVRYVPRKGWGPGVGGHMAAPAMWSDLNDQNDPMDAAFRALGIPVDEPM